MGPAPDGHKVDFAPKFRIDDGPSDNHRVPGAALGHEAKSKPGSDHRENPVVALTPIYHLAAFEPVFPPDRTCIAVKLATDPVEVASAAQVAWMNRIKRSEGVVRGHHNHELLAKERNVVQALIRLPAWETVDRDLQFTIQEALLQVRGAGVDDFELDPGMSGLKAADKIEEFIRLNGAHHTELQGRLLKLAEVQRLTLGFLRFGVN